jgi:hypothetical protein
MADTVVYVPPILAFGSIIPVLPGSILSVMKYAIYRAIMLNYKKSDMAGKNVLPF